MAFFSISEHSNIVRFIWVLLLDCYSENIEAKLQLQAGCCILRLARQPVFVNMMSYKHLHVLALLVMVSIWFLRSYIIHVM